jgi:hypothetical protein
MIRFRCPRCQAALKAPKAKVAGVLVCPGYKETITVPTLAPQPEMALFDDPAERNKEDLLRRKSFRANDKVSRRVPPWVWWSILPGAGVAFVLVVVLLLVLFLMTKSNKPADLIVGSWMDASGKQPGVIVFNADGSADLGGADRSLRFVRYRFIDDYTILITSAIEPHITYQMQVTFPSKDEMQLSGSQGGGTMRRIR